MKLITNWRKCWKFLSVQLMAVGSGISATYATMYQQLKDTIDPKMMAMITAGVFVAGILGRVISQGLDNDS
jgi:sorbitol-specific phosphotransferase system component IIBC